LFLEFLELHISQYVSAVATFSYVRYEVQEIPETTGYTGSFKTT